MHVVAWIFAYSILIPPRLSEPTQSSHLEASLSKKMFRPAVRSLSTAARSSLKIGLIPADGIGKEVIPVCWHMHMPCFQRPRTLLCDLNRPLAQLLKHSDLIYPSLNSLTLLLAGKLSQELVLHCHKKLSSAHAF
jgi:hypothetical protein